MVWGPGGWGWVRPQVTIPFIFGDPRNPNHQPEPPTNHYLTVAVLKKISHGNNAPLTVQNWKGYTVYIASSKRGLTIIHYGFHLGLSKKMETILISVQSSKAFEASGWCLTNVVTILMGNNPKRHTQQCAFQKLFFIPFLGEKKQDNKIKSFSGWIRLPSRELTYPTLGKGKSSSKSHFWGIC